MSNKNVVHIKAFYKYMIKVNSCLDKNDNEINTIWVIYLFIQKLSDSLLCFTHAKISYNKATVLEELLLQ